MKESVDKVLKTLMKYKTEREVDDYEESYQFREGYVKAMNDAFNILKKTMDSEPTEEPNTSKVNLPIKRVRRIFYKKDLEQAFKNAKRKRFDTGVEMHNNFKEWYSKYTS